METCKVVHRGSRHKALERLWRSIGAAAWCLATLQISRIRGASEQSIFTILCADTTMITTMNGHILSFYDSENQFNQ